MRIVLKSSLDNPDVFSWRESLAVENLHSKGQLILIRIL